MNSKLYSKANLSNNKTTNNQTSNTKIKIKGSFHTEKIDIEIKEKEIKTIKKQAILIFFYL
jgi:hypothetical protein